MRIISTLPVLVVGVAAQSTAGPYGQCGGIGFTGPTGCGSGYTCTIYNPYYAQCYPGAATPTSTTSTSSRTSAATTTTTTPNTLSTITTTTTKPSTATTTGSPTGSVPTTLVNSYYWIRAVSAPNYHLYLQSSSPLTPGTALINTHTSAGQFQLTTTDGQLVYYRGSATPLYLNIENPTNKTQRKLKTEFKETKNSYGKFAFQGDTLTWSVADISRPNTAAWLVCAGQELFVNTGAYGYDTPAGCADQTIHSYGGSTADL